MFKTKEEIIDLYHMQDYTPKILRDISRRGKKAVEENDPLVNDIDKWMFTYAGYAADFYSIKQNKKMIFPKDNGGRPQMMKIKNQIIVSVMNDLHSSALGIVNYGLLKKRLVAAYFFAYNSAFLEMGAVRGWYLDRDHAQILLEIEEKRFAFDTTVMVNRVVNEAIVVKKVGEKNIVGVDGDTIDQIAYDIASSANGSVCAVAYCLEKDDNDRVIVKIPE